MKHGLCKIVDVATGEERPAPKGSRLMFLSTRVEGDTLYYVWGEQAP